MDKIRRVGVLGCGYMGLRHVTEYRRMGVEVVAFDTAEPGLAAAERLGMQRVETVDHLLGARDVRVIDVCLPTRLHAETVVSALLSGHHVFCEKPLCLNLAEAQRIQRASEVSGNNVQVGYVYRFAPFLTDLRQHVREGLIGTPRYALIRLGASGSRARWKHEQREGGGASKEMLTHGLDLAMWLFGRPERLEVGAQWQLMPERLIAGASFQGDAEDVSVAQGMFGTVDVVVYADLVSAFPVIFLEVHGSGGVLVTSGFEGGCRLLLSGEPSRHLATADNGMRWLAAELSHFLEGVERGSVAGSHTVGDTVALLECLHLTEVAL